ncbi:MAG: PHP domain-containing protein [Clostridia bacterium]|nr:PHP domain-containing protein [Clostridia bacterium]
MKIETHVHTLESSRCGHVPAKRVAEAYAQAGYDAVIVTDHYNTENLSVCAQKGLSKTDLFLDGYRKVKEEGEKLGLRVFLGAELRFSKSNENDYLVYGLDEEFFIANPDIDLMRFSQFLDMKPEKALVYQAHPFRNGMTVTDPKRLFGMEVFNGHEGHDSRNSFALAWAKHFGLRPIAGSDAHREEALCHGGILTSRDVNSMDELLMVLKAEDYAVFNKNLFDKKWGPAVY